MSRGKRKQQGKRVHHQKYPQGKKDQDTSGNIQVTPESLRALTDVCHEKELRRQQYRKRERERGKSQPPPTRRTTPRPKPTLPEALRPPEPHIIEPQTPETDYVIGHRWRDPTKPPEPVLRHEEGSREIEYDPSDNLDRLIVGYTYNPNKTPVPPDSNELLVVYVQRALVAKVHSKDYEQLNLGEMSEEEIRFLELVNTALNAGDEEVLFNTDFLFLKDNGNFSIRYDDNIGYDDNIARGEVENLRDHLIDSVEELIIDLKNGLDTLRKQPHSTISGVVIPGFRETYPNPMKILEKQFDLRRIIIAEEYMEGPVLRSEIANDPYRAEIFIDNTADGSEYSFHTEEDSIVKVEYNPENHVRYLAYKGLFDLSGINVRPDSNEIIIVYSQESLVERIHAKDFQHYDTGGTSEEEQRFLELVNTALEAEYGEVLFNNEFLFLKPDGSFSIRDGYRIARGETESLSDFLIDSVGELILDLKNGLTQNINTISGVVIPGFREWFPEAMKKLEGSYTLRRIIIAEENRKDIVLRSEIANEPYKAEIFIDL